jgi:hypothetical protein
VYLIATTIPSIVAVGGNSKGWFVQNATLIVGVVGILVSGLGGPSIAAQWTTRREREKDARARAVTQREDLRSVVDEAAKVLGGAVARLRPALEAQLDGQSLSQETRDFLTELFTLGQRLRLRMPVTHSIVRSYDEAREQLIVVSRSTTSRAAFDCAAAIFDKKRAIFLDNAREALNMPIPDKGE